MVGILQPLGKQFAIINPDGTPTEYFIRWAQQRQIDIGTSITLEEAQALIDAWAAARDINAGVALNGGGTLAADVTIDHADTAVTPGTYGDATHVPQVTVDQQGHITGVTNVAISGGSGGNWWFSPPTAASFSLQSGDATNVTLTDDGNVGLILKGGTPVSGDITRMAYRTLTTKTLDWDFIIRLDWFMDPANFGSLGIRLHDSVGGKVLAYGFRNGDNNQLNRTYVNALTGGFFSEVLASMRGYIQWLRIARVGANFTFYLSADGKNWHTWRTDAVTAFLANAPDRIGIGVSYNRSGSFDTLEYSVPYFSLTGPAV